MTSPLSTVLVIDDDESMLDVTVAILNQIGFPAVGRTNADGVIQALKEMPLVHVLLCDIHLESGSGPDLVRRALRDRPELKVVFMSGGFADIPFRRSDPLIDKPLDRQSLKRAIDDVLNRRNQPFERRKIPDRRAEDL
jgi:two-component system cell cycle sensor histidine kinase/response regulator CckA